MCLDSSLLDTAYSITPLLILLPVLIWASNEVENGRGKKNAPEAKMWIPPEIIMRDEKGGRQKRTAVTQRGSHAQRLNIDGWLVFLCW